MPIILTPIEDKKDDAYWGIESKKLDLEAGFFGKLFGSKLRAPLNIAGIFVLSLVASGIAVLFFTSAIPANDYWKIIAPLITLALGFIFGKSTVE